MSRDWSRREVEATVADYFAMLTKELAGESVNKSARNRALQTLLADRSAGSIEFKHSNISAVLLELGFPYIDGYKPRGNYQDLLRQVVVERLDIDQGLHAAAEVAVELPTLIPSSSYGWDDILVPVPESDRSRERVYDRRRTPGQSGTRINYLEREARNRSLGEAGEKFVMEVEHRRLWQAGERRLADRVEHVSSVRGDGLGYDILSYEPDGRERLIEVKTTRFGAMTPFFASLNEVEVSTSLGAQYHLYRLFKFPAIPKMYVLPGPLDQSVVLQAIMFRASLP